MTAQFVNFGKAVRDLTKINVKIGRIEDIATTRTLNILLARQEKEIAANVSKEYGITQAAARQKTTTKKATKSNKVIGFTFESARTNLLKVKPLKSGGISHQAKGKRQVKITTRIKAGSKPFLINAKAGGQTGGDNIEVAGGNKKVPVYMAAGSKRKVTTMKGSSIARMVESVEIDGKLLEKAILKSFSYEYREQLKKAKFRGRF